MRLNVLPNFHKGWALKCLLWVHHASDNAVLFDISRRIGPYYNYTWLTVWNKIQVEENDLYQNKHFEPRKQLEVYHFVNYL